MQKPVPFLVVFSNRAYNAMITETFAKDPLETGGFFIGHVLSNGCYIVVDVIPPGMKSVYRRAFFEYDAPMVNYTGNWMVQQYKLKPHLLGLWHRHPGSMNVFSSTDDETNAMLAESDPNGILSGLINLIPDLHLTLYHVGGFRKYTRVKYAVGDQMIPPKYLELCYDGSVNLHPSRPMVQKPAVPSKPKPQKPEMWESVPTRTPYTPEEFGNGKPASLIASWFGQAVDSLMKEQMGPMTAGRMVYNQPATPQNSDSVDASEWAPEIRRTARTFPQNNEFENVAAENTLPTAGLHQRPVATEPSVGLHQRPAVTEPPANPTANELESRTTSDGVIVISKTVVASECDSNQPSVGFSNSDQMTPPPLPTTAKENSMNFQSESQLKPVPPVPAEVTAQIQAQTPVSSEAIDRTFAAVFSTSPEETDDVAEVPEPTVEGKERVVTETPETAVSPYSMEETCTEETAKVEFSTEGNRLQVPENPAAIPEKGLEGPLTTENSAMPESPAMSESPAMPESPAMTENENLDTTEIPTAAESQTVPFEGNEVPVAEALPPVHSAEDDIPTANELSARRPTPRVYYPTSMQTAHTEGPLWGKYIPETNIFNVLPANTPLEHDEIGWFFPSCPFENPECVRALPTQKTHTEGTSGTASEGTAETSQSLLARITNLIGKTESVQETPVLRPEYRGWALWQADEPKLLAWLQDGKLRFVQFPDLEECEQDPYSLKLDIFSRNKGLLESDVMLKKGAVLIGCGSVGSLVGLELARAGVGRFLLLDDDVLGYHNICRHQCGIPDVGRFKTDALRDRILQINPTAHVEVYHAPIQSVPLDVISSFADHDTIYIGGADNREGDLYASQLAQETDSAFLSVGCWERAFAGEIFYTLPEKDMASYAEFLEKTGSLSHRVNQNRIFYTTEQDLAKATFEPGISTDMSFVTLVAIKLALDILNRDNPGYTTRVLDYLTQYTLVCNTNKEALGGINAGIFSHPLQVTHSIYIPRG